MSSNSNIFLSKKFIFNKIFNEKKITAIIDLIFFTEQQFLSVHTHTTCRCLRGADKSEPLPERVTERGRQVAHVAHDDVVLEGEGVEVTVDAAQLPLGVEHGLSKINVPY